MRSVVSAMRSVVRGATAAASAQKRSMMISAKVVPMPIFWRGVAIFGHEVMCGLLRRLLHFGQCACTPAADARWLQEMPPRR